MTQEPLAPKWEAEIQRLLKQVADLAFTIVELRAEIERLHEVIKKDRLSMYRGAEHLPPEQQQQDE